ncbi:hypothetical protein [Agromyces sp. CCNWLW203]|uniref:hypothetical protein n=1 Tax=Agromyces sp. CCNWLW203 TaxID=3112842 RepID=UPI002F96A863
MIELNEAFAVQVLACLADWGIDAEDPRLNPRGSGISIGHPIGATGIRMLATLAYEMIDLDREFAAPTRGASNPQCGGADGPPPVHHPPRPDRRATHRVPELVRRDRDRDRDRAQHSLSGGVLCPGSAATTVAACGLGVAQSDIENRGI